MSVVFTERGEPTESRDVWLNRFIVSGSDVLKDRYIRSIGIMYTVYMYNGSLVFPKEPVTDIEDYHCNPKNYTGAAFAVIRGSQGLSLYRRSCGQDMTEI